ncbi:outer membrane beta-barrel protein [Chitinophaga sp. Cy-1792]|uniref:outer membrane beta-barrel protein n=1 Tax=Chitinophaga sp. Cy-1792 TaxID=2608339 RepID=UPI001422F3B2|nr:outer membrane beta-barrel protein [Chitinophaga sp. Cy-1792]NIG56473.1 PorT family protein [Chitinophaga sp. Cy-1792]
MKKIILTVVTVCSCCYAEAQFRIGVKAGLGQSYFSKYEAAATPGLTTTTDNYQQEHRITYYGGITADWQLTKHFSVQPSLLYSSKAGGTGVKVSWASPDYRGFNQTQGYARLNYLELPLNFVYKQKLGPGQLLAGAGIAEALYLNGYKEGGFMMREAPEHVEYLPYSGTTPNIAYSGRRGPFYPNSQADAKLWDTGINFTAGYEFPSKLQLSLNYGLGLKETYYGKNRTYSISAAYYLHK